MENIIIRKAKRSDCPRLLELVQELAVYEKEPDAVTVTLEHFTQSGFGEKPVWWAIVAASPSADGKGDTVHGFVLYYIRYSTWKGQRLYLEDFVVTNEMRGKGLGKLLFDALIAEGKGKGFSAIVWQVLDWNEPAIHFYKKYNAHFDKGWINCSIEI